MTVTLNKMQIVEGWECGLFSNLAYIHLALQYDNEKTTSVTLNLDDFVADWQGVGDGEKKPKKLTAEIVLKALADLAKKERLSMSIQQLSLDLF